MASCKAQCASSGCCRLDCGGAPHPRFQASVSFNKRLRPCHGQVSLSDVGQRTAWGLCGLTAHFPWGSLGEERPRIQAPATYCSTLSAVPPSCCYPVAAFVLGFRQHCTQRPRSRGICTFQWWRLSIWCEARHTCCAPEVRKLSVRCRPGHPATAAEPEHPARPPLLQWKSDMQKL